MEGAYSPGSGDIEDDIEEGGGVTRNPVRTFSYTQLENRSIQSENEVNIKSRVSHRMQYLTFLDFSLQLDSLIRTVLRAERTSLFYC